MGFFGVSLKSLGLKREASYNIKIPASVKYQVKIRSDRIEDLILKTMIGDGDTTADKDILLPDQMVFVKNYGFLEKHV